MYNLKKGGAGVIVLIIVVLLILAGVLFYTNQNDSAEVIEDATMETASDTPEVQGASVTAEPLVGDAVEEAPATEGAAEVSAEGAAN